MNLRSHSHEFMSSYSNFNSVNSTYLYFRYIDGEWRTDKNFLRWIHMSNDEILSFKTIWRLKWENISISGSKLIKSDSIRKSYRGYSYIVTMPEAPKPHWHAEVAHLLSDMYFNQLVRTFQFKTKQNFGHGWYVTTIF